MYIKRITADEFLGKMNTEAAWSIVFDDMIGEIVLTVREDKDVRSYLGPNPLEVGLMDLTAFMYRVEERIRPRISDVIKDLPRLTTDEFFALIDGAVMWTTNINEGTQCVELIALMPNAIIKRCISVNLNEMTQIESHTFIALLEKMNREKN